MPAICHLTSSHRALDNRIFFSELISLKKYGLRCSVVGIHPKKYEIYFGITIIGIEAKSRKTGTYLRQPICSFKKALSIPAAIFHFHDPTLIPAGIILKLLGKHIIYDVHDDYEASVLDRLRQRPTVARIASKLWWFFERCTCWFFDGVVVADRHLERKFAWKKPVVLGNYPRLDFTPPADTSYEKTFNIIFVGGVTEERGVGKVIDAIDLLPYENIRFHIIGDCKDSGLLVRIRRNTRVRYFGRVAWSDLHQYYTKAHLGVALYQPLASFISAEYSVKIIEYMAAGIPVLCSDFPGLKEFVEEATYGLTAPPDNPQAIAEKIRYLYENPDVRTTLGQNGRRAFENEHNWENHEGKLVSLYQCILDGKITEVPVDKTR